MTRNEEGGRVDSDLGRRSGQQFKHQEAKEVFLS